MPFAAASTFFRTLRFRLTLWNTIVVLVLLVTALLGIHQGLWLAMMRMMDEFLSEELLDATLDVERLYPQRELYELLDRRAVAHPRRALFIQLFDPDGHLLWSSAQSPDMEVPFQQHEDSRFFTSFAHYRLVQKQVRAPGGKVLTIRTGCSIKRARQELNEFTRIMVAVGLFLALLAPLGGYWLAARATRPVARIIETTNRLHPAHLDERLPIRHTRDELDQLSLTINGFLDRIATHLKQTRDFTANAAHELRSPLTALQSTLEVALNADRSAEQYREILTELLEECSQLRVLVNQLLLLAEGDAGGLCGQREPVRLDQIVRRSLDMFTAAAETAGVELRPGIIEPVVVSGDSMKLWQVVNNLLDNAMKFTPAGGHIEVSVQADLASGAAVLRVADSGPGIAPEDLPQVFERFYQGDRSRRREGRTRGTGLGLAICQAIVSAHGGTISVQSVLGAGTTFTVRLPGCSLPSLVSAIKSEDGQPCP
jgi:two-component system heavy metal sensor histidine kinase CusS